MSHVPQSRKRHSHVHVRMGEIWLQVDCCRKVVECRCKLPKRKVHQPQVVSSNPFERIQVNCTLQSRHCSHKLAQTKEAHTNIIPELCTVWGARCCNSVLGQGNFVIVAVLHDGACCQNRARISWIMCQRVSKALECFELLSHAEVSKSQSGQQLRVVWRKLQRILVRPDGFFMVLSQRIHPSQLQVRRVMALYAVGFLKRPDGVFILLQIHETHAFRMRNLPILHLQVVRHLFGLVQNVQGSLMLSKEIQRASHLLQVVSASRREESRCLEQGQAFFDLALLPADEACGQRRTQCKWMAFTRLERIKRAWVPCNACIGPAIAHGWAKTDAS